MSAPPIPHNSPPAAGLRRVSTWWRALSIFLLLILLVAWAASTSMVAQLRAQIHHLQTQLVELPQVTQVAVLLDDKQLPAMLITHTAKNQLLLLQRLDDVREGREDSMQLWAIAGDAAPRSLGVIESKYKTLQIPVAKGALDGVTSLAISVENKGGVPERVGPRLPWLFKGWLVQKSI